MQIRLGDGTTFDLCQIVGVSPQWVMVAVRDLASHHDRMAVELVPFEMIRGVSIRARHAEGATRGVSQFRVPEMLVRRGACARSCRPTAKVAAEGCRAAGDTV